MAAQDQNAGRKIFWARVACLAVLTNGLFACAALAQEADAAATTSGLNAGDTAWVLTSSAIVLMMTVPGLALFYGGLVRAKNVLSVLMQCLATLAIVSVIWVLWGYSLAFGPDHGGIIGDLSLFSLRGVSHQAGAGENIPPMAFMVFQLMFAAITPALITGAFAERMKFSAFFLFVIAWSTFVYSPLAHWVWAKGGWLLERGALDFAGGTVVHISSGTSALVAAALVGKRSGYGTHPTLPHNVPFAVVGAGLLWVGWFGFNAGSALAANGIAVLAFVNTNTATAAAVLGWIFAEWIGRGKPTVLGGATGAVAGLVAITPAAGFVEPWSSLIIGALAGLACYKAVGWKNRLGYDDALDVVGVHGVGGTLGAIATGIFAVKTGLLATGSWSQVGEQAIAVAATYAFAGIGTAVLLGLVKGTVGLRVDEADEETGLDLALHSETAYSTVSGSPVGELVQARPENRVTRPSVKRDHPASGQRTPPLHTSSKREPPRSSTLSAAAGSDRTFRVVIEGVDAGLLKNWWRDLCHREPAQTPQAFREIYPNVMSFDGRTYRFRGADPQGTIDRIAYLLDVYGASGATVRIAEAG